MDWPNGQIKLLIMVRQHMEPLVKQDQPDLLQQHAMAYNTSVQASVGYEPLFLMHGFHAATAVEIVLPTPIAITGDNTVEESKQLWKDWLRDSNDRNVHTTYGIRMFSTGHDRGSDTHPRDDNETASTF